MLVSPALAGPAALSSSWAGCTRLRPAKPDSVMSRTSAARTTRPRERRRAPACCGVIGGSLPAAPLEHDVDCHRSRIGFPRRSSRSAKRARGQGRVWIPWAQESTGSAAAASSLNQAPCCRVESSIVTSTTESGTGRGPRSRRSLASSPLSRVRTAWGGTALSTATASVQTAVSAATRSRAGQSHGRQGAWRWRQRGGGLEEPRQQVEPGEGRADGHRGDVHTGNGAPHVALQRADAGRGRGTLEQRTLNQA